MNDKLESTKPSTTPSKPIAQQTEALEQDMLSPDEIQQLLEKIKETRKWLAEQDRNEGRGTKDENHDSPDPSTTPLPGGNLNNSDSRTLVSDAPLPEEIEARTSSPKSLDEEGRQNSEQKMDQPEFKNALHGITPEEWAAGREKIRQQEILMGKLAGLIPPDSPEEAVELERHRKLGDTVGTGILPEKGGSSQPSPMPSPSAKHDDPLPEALLSDPPTPKKSWEHLTKMLEENERYEALHHWGGETGRLYREMLRAKEKEEEQYGKECPKENRLGSPPNDNNDDSRLITGRLAPLSPEEIMDLRRAEEKNRFNRQILEEKTRLLANPIKITCYRPKEGGADLVISILHGNDNICAAVADELYELYTDECDREKIPILAYGVGEIFTFSDGLGFRLHDSGEGSPEGRRFTLGFSAPCHTGEAKTRLLLEIPRLLRKSGVDDESALKKLADFLLPSQVAEHCAICREYSDDDNLIACRECQRWFCYRCGDWGHTLCEHCLSRRKIQIEAYKPKERADLALRIYKKTDINPRASINTPEFIDISKQTAFLLYANQCKEKGLTPEDIEYDAVYEFANGVVFSAHDEGGYPRKITLEFMAAPERERNETLPYILLLLKQAGINDEGALNRLENFIKDKKAVNLPMLNG